MTAVKHPTLYKKDSKGKVRVWWVETDEDQYRVVAGLEDGKLVENDWKTAQPKNVGRANATTGAEQALSEMQSLYDKQLNQGKYHESKDTIDEDGYFEPMLAEKWNDDKDRRVGIKAVEKAFASGVRVFVQPKFDGIRNIANSVDMRSRDGQPRVSCPHIHEYLTGPTKFFGQRPDATLDGELYNHEFHDDFNAIQSLILQRKPKPEDLAASREKAQYFVYDVFIGSVPDMLFSQRYEMLKAAKALGLLELPIVLVPTIEVHSMEEIDEQYGHFLDQKYEGMIVRIDGPYENRRTKNLIKRKEFFDEEFKVVDILPGTGNWAGKAKSVVFEYGSDGETTDAGISGTEAEMAELLRNKQRYIGGEVTVRFPNKTPAGKPRFGVAKAFYEGKRRS